MGIEFGKWRLLADLSNDVLMNTTAPPSHVQAEVGEEQQPPKLQESANQTHVLHPWLGTNRMHELILIAGGAIAR